MAKVERFEDLIVWREAQRYAVDIYKITNSYPSHELYGIVSQIRRRAASISANIAEGFGRRSPNDKLHFCTIAYGSLLETKNFLYLSHSLNYLAKERLLELLDQGTELQKLINAYKRPLV